MPVVASELPHIVTAVYEQDAAGNPDRSDNYWNLTGTCSLTNPNQLDDAGASFVAAHIGKPVRVYLNGIAVNAGIYEVESVPLATRVLLRGRLKYNGVSDVLAPSRFTTLDDEFTDDDVGKIIRIESGPDSGETATILTVIDSKTVTHSGSFESAEDVQWRLNPNFSAESGVSYELCAVGSVAGLTLTLPRNLPDLDPVWVEYSVIPSAELLRDENVENEFTDYTGPPPTQFLDKYYPFYLADPSGYVRDLVDLITAAGCIPVFK